MTDKDVPRTGAFRYILGSLGDSEKQLLAMWRKIYRYVAAIHGIYPIEYT